MGSHSVTCHPTQVNVPFLTSASEGWYSIYSIYFPRWHGRLSWPRWLVTYWNGLPTYRWWSPIQVLTGPDVEHLLWSRPTRYHYARPDHCSSDLLVKNGNILYPSSVPLPWLQWSNMRSHINRTTCGLYQKVNMSTTAWAAAWQSHSTRLALLRVRTSLVTQPFRDGFGFDWAVFYVPTNTV